METIVIRDKNTKEEKVVVVRAKEKDYVVIAKDLEVLTGSQDFILGRFGIKPDFD